ncbi:hypothetical protein SLEP1_g35036 [Rubroshorea leprosula]|uniref:Integrase catalytic domain-containing protein n=1 Tax=Rubroshorea leprosula TaxID=152421 RepID=A0AAV5KM05_9ROSI|nr:hypothetical protein SLEP1_g35036 [Rubroshorea leprosula]
MESFFKNVVFLFYFLLVVKVAGLQAAKDECQTKKCNHHIIWFLYQLKVQQLQHCGYHGFELSYEDKQTVPKLPRNVKLFVKRIDYKAKRIQLYDPQGCFPLQLPNLNLSASSFQYLRLTPFQFNSVESKYSLFNCSRKAAMGINYEFYEIPYLSVSSFQVLAFPSDSTSAFNLLSCRRTSLNTLETLVYEHMLYYQTRYVHLSWSQPDCSKCEEVARKCKLKKNNRTQDDTECYGTTKNQRGENYSMWSVKMKVFLKGNGLWDLVENGFHPPHLPNNPTIAQLKNHSKYVEKAYQALSHIHSGVVDSLFPRIMGVETEKEAWDTLKIEFEGDTKVKGNNVITLKRQVEMLRMLEDETVHQYSTKLQDLVNRIRANGGEFPNKRVVEKIMVSVPDKFESKILAIEETCDLDTMTVNELISKLKAHDQRLTLKGQVAATEGAFQSRQKGKQVVTSSDSKPSYDSLDKGNLVETQTQPCCSYAAKCDDTWLWHKRYGHFNMKSLKFLQTNELVRDLPSINLSDDVCEACQLGKLHRQAFPVNQAWRATEKLELIHTDICGPMKIESLSSNKYFILFIDDFTRMTWTLRFDNGKEYTSSEFNKICEDAGIGHQLTVPYSPQQNGVSERKNRTVMEMARCMLHAKRLPKSFLAEVVYTTLYLLNSLPTKVVKGKTMVEAWYGIKPSANHLKVFGSVCYSHVLDVKRTKLDQKANVGIFVGYATQSKGYRVYDVHSKKKVDVDGTRIANSNLNGRISDTDDDSPILKTKSLEEIYEQCSFTVDEPSNYAEASTHEEWRNAMQEELSAIEKNVTWSITSRSEDKNVIGVKWVYRSKLNAYGSLNKYKARLVVKGYAQQPGVDFGETFSLVARHDTIRLLLALAAQKKWKVYHLDVKSTFLNGILEEKLYVEQPEGFLVQGCEDHVYKLHKALYGLKQALRAWYSRIDSYLIKQGFQRGETEFTLYDKSGNPNSQLLVSHYVDDLLVTRGDAELQKFKASMQNEFEMTNLGVMKYFLGMEVMQCSNGMFVS